MIVVPLTEGSTLVLPALAVRIEPTPENGCTKFCWAASHLLTATSLKRVHTIPSRVTSDQLAAIPRKIVLSIGLGSAEGE